MIVIFSLLYIGQNMHNNWHSFVRQLNLYGFRKVYHFNIAIDYASGRQETVWQFKHRHFQRDDEESLLLIQRKLSSYTLPIEKEEQRYAPLMADIERRLAVEEKQFEEMKRETQSLRQQQQNQQKLLLKLMNDVLSVSEKLHPPGPEHRLSNTISGSVSGGFFQRERNKGDDGYCNSRKGSNSLDHNRRGSNLLNGEMNDHHHYSLPPLADMMSNLSEE
ncbi:unnamed protein product [Absidia cylindrospora]